MSSVELFFPSSGTRPIVLVGRRLPGGKVTSEVRAGALEVSAGGAAVARIAVPLDRIADAGRGVRVAELPADDDLARVRAGALTQPLTALADDVAAGGTIAVPKAADRPESKDEPQSHVEARSKDEPRAPLFSRLKRLVAGAIAVATVVIGVGFTAQDVAKSDPSVTAPPPVAVEMSTTIAAPEITTSGPGTSIGSTPSVAPAQSVNLDTLESVIPPAVVIDSPTAPVAGSVTENEVAGSATVKSVPLPTVKSVPLPTVKPVPPMIDMAIPVNQAKSAIVKASMTTGAALPELLAIGEIESGFDFTAEAPTSSATGIFQFTEQSWYAALKKWGHEHGAGHLADKIRPGKISGFTPIDPNDKQMILDARKDPVLNAALGAELTQENRSNLQARIGRVPTGGEIYISHFLGLDDAARFIAMGKRYPHATAAPHFAEAAASNPWVFKNRDGSLRTFGQISALFDGKMNRLIKVAQDIAPDFLCQAASDAPSACVQQVAQDSAAADAMQRFKVSLTAWQPATGEAPRLKF